MKEHWDKVQKSFRHKCWRRVSHCSTFYCLRSGQQHLHVPAWAVVLHVLTLASATVHPQVHWQGGAWPNVELTAPTCQAPVQTKMLSAAAKVVTKCGIYQFILSGNWLLYTRHKIISKPSLAGMYTGTDWGENNSFEHSTQQCVQICFTAALWFSLIANMSCSFVSPTQKCVLLGVRFYSWLS
jgi:hypothetical protein